MNNGVLIEKDAEGALSVSVKQIDLPELGPDSVRVRVDYSTLNYKDALAITNTAPVVRSFPMVPGIDFAGTVESSNSDEFAKGDKVILNGWGVGEKHWGGFAQMAQVRAGWLIPMPDGLDSLAAMSIGTAGYTAMLCVLALERQGIVPGDGDVLVTGASGGVGSIAVLVLSKRGYRVIAATGKAQVADYLRGLGAADILDSAELVQPAKPLAKERWAAAVDAVGGNVLANVCAGTAYRGVVAACGNAGGMGFPSSVAPFILRGVTLVGIDSVMCPRPERIAAWQRLQSDLDLSRLGDVTTRIGLAETIPAASDLINRKLRGRAVVDVNK